MVKIVQKENPVLRGDTREVPVKEIGSAKIKKIIADMKIALAREDDGVAIAAPQIGMPLRIFVVSGKVDELMGKTSAKDDGTESQKDRLNAPATSARGRVFINPVIKKLSQKKELTEEGCLSVRYLYGKVKRSVKATIEAYDENGVKKIFGASGLLAQIFQHEVDHLNGILFTDKAFDVEEIIPPHVTKQNKNVAGK
jgi:peptide deformylase